MATFDPTLALLGGLLIGIASVLLMVLIGRIAGISGILAELWRLGLMTRCGASPSSRVSLSRRCS